MAFKETMSMGQFRNVSFRGFYLSNEMQNYISISSKHIISVFNIFDKLAEINHL